MKTFFSIFFAVAFSYAVAAQDNPNWLRYPAISPDGQTIAFTFKGDIYTVPANGGTAKQLTAHEAHDYMPVWSNDGKTLAFASDRYGNFDVFTINADGGKVNRLTYHSNNELPFSFTPDDKYVVFGGVRMDIAEHRQYPTASQPELYKVSTQGGRVDQVFTIPAEYVQISKDGSKIVYHDKKGGENEFRKHHTSSVTRDIWIFDTKENKHVQLTSFEGENRQPVFSEDERSIYYLSEESGSFNIHKMNIYNPTTNTQITKFDGFPVRFLSMGNGLLSFGYNGELYTMKEGEQPRKVNVRINELSTSNSDKIISINGGVREMDISPDGKEIAFIAQGEVFVTSTDGSFTKRITNTPEQERFVRFTADGKGVVYASERNGKWSIYKTTKIRDEEPFFYASTLIKEEVLIGNDEDNYLPEFSPDGKKMAYIAGRRTLRIMDLDSKKTIDLLTPEDLFHMRDGDQSFTWSPDSKWLLVDWRKIIGNGEILLLAADGSKRVNLTESGYYDSSAKWVNGGKQVLWFSDRDGMRSQASSGRTQSDVYTLFFTQDAFDEFNMSKEEYELMKEIEKVNKKDADDDSKDSKKNDKSDKKETVEDLKFDWDGLNDRKKRLTIHSASMGDAILSKDADKLYYLASFEGGMNLWETDLKTRETKIAIRLNAGFGSSLVWDKKQENLYLLSNGRISKVNLSAGNTKGISISGEMYYDEIKEREHMFDHVYNRTKNIFYEPTFHGNDWDQLYKDYKKYLPSIGNNFEFTEMLSEMLGELNVSHSGARYSNSIENGDATAALGVFIDYEFKGDGIKITEILKGGPLDKAKLDIKPGMIIEKIDGELLSADKDYAQFLNRKAGKFVLLDVVDANKKNRQQITVKPILLGQESGLLYKRFVDKNVEEVLKLSDGQLGYVHIPGMSDGPYRTIYEGMLGKFADLKGVIVDTRFNGGGDLVSDLAMFFTGVPFLTYATADKEVGGEPSSRYTKPTLVMFNESNYSDGHCFAQGYTDLGIGKTVGMPVPGTCSFAGWDGLLGGGMWGVVPVSVKNKAGEWMENNQTEPTFQVKNMPGIIDNGRDQQLEKAVKELLNDVK